AKESSARHREWRHCHQRRVNDCSAVCSYGAFFGYWQFQGENGAVSGSVALRDEAAAHLFGGQRGAVQAEAVAFLARGETMGENLRDILRRDADAGVGDRDLCPALTCI